jgi:hypothetical protein
MSYFQSVDQVRLLLEQIGVGIEQMLGTQIRKTATEGPEMKRREYPAEAYHDQIEKNAIYLREAMVSLNAAIVEYLKHGQPLLRPDQIDEFVTYTRVTRSRQVTLLHLNYIRHGCTGCQVHAEHGPYAKLRQMVQDSDWPRYLEEMEFSYVYYQAASMMAANYLAQLLNQHNLAASARAIPPEELAGVVQERVFLRTDVCLGNFHLEVPPDLQNALKSQASKPEPSPEESSEKKWWQVWK